MKLTRLSRRFSLGAAQGNNEQRARRMSRYVKRVAQMVDVAMRQEAGQSFGSTKNQPSRLKRAGGFTIIELSIASATFATILLIGMVSFVEAGRLYYKGVTISQTRNSATNVLNDVELNIHLSSSVSGRGASGGNRYYYCVGSHRYTFHPLQLVNLSSHDNVTKFGLLEDQLPGSNGCGDPFAAVNPVPLMNPTELLGNQMRIMSFTITAQATNLYSINLVIAHGPTNTLTSPLSASSTCKTGAGSAQFCAITSLSTIVFEGI